jgi:hypothetical protein
MVLLDRATEAGKGLSRTESVGSLLPGPVLKVVSLEFDGVVSDYLFMTTMAYLGSKLEKARFVLTGAEWASVDRMLTVSSELDPCFVDPYYIANAFLTWDAGMIRETNALLELGVRCRSWDWTLPFFIGFNNFFFLNDYEKASEYLFLASRSPGANPMLASIASKLAYKENKTEHAIMFLKTMLEQTEDEYRRDEFKKRIAALETRMALEQAVEKYRRKFNRSPSRIDQLVTSGMLAAIPSDPLGGAFTLSRGGKVESTADSMLLPGFRNERHR